MYRCITVNFATTPARAGVLWNVKAVFWSISTYQAFLRNAFFTFSSHRDVWWVENIVTNRYVPEEPRMCGGEIADYTRLIKFYGLT
jgi:hypothetical protein